MDIDDIDCSKYSIYPSSYTNHEWYYFELPGGLWEELKDHYPENKQETVRDLIGMYWQLLCGSGDMVDYDDLLCYAETVLELLED